MTSIRQSSSSILPLCTTKLSGKKRARAWMKAARDHCYCGRGSSLDCNFFSVANFKRPVCPAVGGHVSVCGMSACDMGRTMGLLKVPSF